MKINREQDSDDSKTNRKELTYKTNQSELRNISRGKRKEKEL